MSTEYRKGMRKIDHQNEMRIVALLARGDTHRDIVDDLASKGLEISIQSVSAVKRRNKALLDQMNGAIAEREAANATRILDKTHKMLNRKLDEADKDERKLRKLLERYHNGEIDERDLKREKQGLTKLSVAELTHLSREMFAQRTKATENTEEKPKPNKEQMEELMEAIKRGDKVTMQQIVFND